MNALPAVQPLLLMIQAVAAAQAAAREILAVYATPFTVDTKSDNSPITQADRAATVAIEQLLRPTALAILSEEGMHAPHEERRGWQWYWLVDPLDGTREFVSRNGDFTVNIALMDGSLPAGGVVYVPVTGQLYVAYRGAGAWTCTLDPRATPPCTWESLTAVSVRLPCAPAPGILTVVASRSHLDQRTREYIEHLETTHGQVTTVSRGSSLKLCMLAEGSADMYPRFGPTMEWDIAAGHAIVRESGGSVLLIDESGEMSYNKQDLRNPSFVARSAHHATRSS